MQNAREREEWKAGERVPERERGEKNREGERGGVCVCACVHVHGRGVCACKRERGGLCVLAHEREINDVCWRTLLPLLLFLRSWETD